MYEYDLGSCIKCPEAQTCLARLVMVAGMRDFAVSLAMDPRMDQRSELLYSTFRDSGVLTLMETLVGEQIANPDDLVKAVRQTTADGLENWDGQITQEKTKLDDMTENCNGPLKMRATRASRTITATICNSPQKADGHTHEAVVVDRSHS